MACKQIKHFVIRFGHTDLHMHYIISINIRYVGLYPCSLSAGQNYPSRVVSDGNNLLCFFWLLIQSSMDVTLYFDPIHLALMDV